MSLTFSACSSEKLSGHSIIFSSFGVAATNWGTCPGISITHPQSVWRTYSLLARNTTPHVGARVEPSRHTLTTRLLVILLHDLLELALDLRKVLERDIRDLVLLAVFFQPQALAREQHISLPRSREIRHAVADEDDQRDLVVESVLLREGAALLDGAGLVVSERRVV